MEMMTQMPVMKTQAAPSQSKAKQNDTDAAEAVSFPTLLQDNSEALEAGKSKKAPAASTDAEPQPSPLLVSGNLNSQTGSILTEGLSPLLSGALVETAETGLSPESATPVAVAEDVLAAVGTPGAMVEAVIQEAMMPVTAEEANLESPIPASTTQAADISTASASEVASATGSIEEAPDPAIAQILTKVSTAGADNPETKNEMPKNDIPVPSTGEPKASVDGKVAVSSAEISTALVDDKAITSKMPVEQKPVENPETKTVTETMKFEVVKDASETEQPVSPAVENPALARQSSAELDMLTAQANAQKNYQQPVAVADQGAIPKPTLADLDLDSGSFESSEQKDQSISRILSSINSSTSSVKRSIQGQVLSRVVDHLQEEIGKEKLTIRLNPEKLGQIEILFQAEGDKLSITMSSAGKDAEQAIQEGTRELAEKITENSARYNLVDIKVENRGSEQQSKQDARQEEKREKSGQGQEQQQQEGQRHTADHNQETGIGEWAAFHLGG